MTDIQERIRKMIDQLTQMHFELEEFANELDDLSKADLLKELSYSVENIYHDLEDLSWDGSIK